MTLLCTRIAALPERKQSRTAAVLSRSGSETVGAFKKVAARIRNRTRCGVGQPRSIANVSLIFVLFALLPLALCSCVHTSPPPSEQPSEQTSGAEFVYIASVHSQPVENEPQPSAWRHVYELLEGHRIVPIMTSSGGVASISVERNRAREAVELLRGDAARKGYWIKISKDF